MKMQWLLGCAYSILAFIAYSGVVPSTTYADYWVRATGSGSAVASHFDPITNANSISDERSIDTGQLTQVTPAVASGGATVNGFIPISGGLQQDASFTFNAVARLGIARASAHTLASVNRVGSPAIRGTAGGSASAQWLDVVTFHGAPGARLFFKVSTTLHVTVHANPATSCSKNTAHAGITAPILSTIFINSCDDFQRSVEQIIEVSDGETRTFSGFVTVASNAGATGLNTTTLNDEGHVDAEHTSEFFLDPITPGASYVTSSGTSYRSAVPNQAPIAHAGVNQTVQIRTQVTLDGTASTDPDNNVPLSYAWNFVSKPAGSAATLSNPTTSMPSFTADALGDFIVQLVVTDSLGAHSSPNNITVSTINSAPVSDAGPDQFITVVGTTVSLNGTGSYDPDGDAITYKWSLMTKPAGSIATLTGEISPTTSFIADMRGDYVASVVVTDQAGASSTADTVTISYNNLKPLADAGGNQASYVNETVTLTGLGSSDPNHDPLTYSWTITSKPSGSGIILSSTTSSQPTFRPDVPGTYVGTLMVSDGFLVSEPSNTTVEVTSRHDQLTQILHQAINAINALSDLAMKNGNMKKPLTNKINAVLQDIEHRSYQPALNKLQHDVLAKIDGCSTAGSPNKNDWLTECNAQSQVTPLIRQAITLLGDLM